MSPTQQLHIFPLTTTNLKCPWRQFAGLNTIVKFAENQFTKLWIVRKTETTAKSDEMLLLNFFMHENILMRCAEREKKISINYAWKKWRFYVSEFESGPYHYRVSLPKIFFLTHKKIIRRIRISLLISQFMIRFHL